jgi:hypothetical protein
LLGLQSILMIPGNDDGAIQLFHTSLRDFLISPLRSCNFFIDPPACHLVIAANCLRVIAVHPREDIFYSQKEMYACLNWCHHLKQGVIGVDNLPNSPTMVSLMSRVRDFASQSIGCWVNTSLDEGHSQLYMLESAISELRVSVRLLPLCSFWSLQWIFFVAFTRPRPCADFGKYQTECNSMCYLQILKNYLLILNSGLF